MVETDYLASLSEQVPRGAWASIVSSAVESAMKGDPKAREWLSRYLLPNDKGNHLSKIAELETLGSDNRADLSGVHFPVAGEELALEE